MKTNRILLTVASLSLLAAAAVCGPHLAVADARADGPDGLGTWEGSGTTTEIDGKPSTPFTVVLTRSATTSGAVRADGKIKLSDGKEVVFWQETTEKPGGRFRLVSSLGAGGGCCFANGMCQSLEEREDGRGFASTIAKDGTDKIRVLVTELQGGRAVRFHAQTLAKRR